MDADRLIDLLVELRTALHILIGVPDTQMMALHPLVEALSEILALWEFPWFTTRCEGSILLDVEIDQ